MSNKGLSILAVVGLLAGACSASSGATTTPSGSPAEVTEGVSPTSEPVAVESTPNDDFPDLASGIRLVDLEPDRALWAIPDFDSSGCEGGEGWRIWSVPNAGDDPFLASVTLFSGPPNVHHPSGGLLFTSLCEEQSWQIIFATIDDDGSFLSEVPIAAPGYEDHPIQDVLWDSARDHIVFTLSENDRTRLVALNPTNQVVDDDFILESGDQGCSAQGVTITLPAETEMTDAARTTRDRIASAASACQFDVLEQIGGGAMGYSFDADQRGAARYWALLEYFGEDPLRQMLNLLALESASEIVGDSTLAYGWPKASILPLASYDDSVRQQLLDLGYGLQQTEETMESGVYYGYRIAIDTDGNWLWFLAGD